MYRYYYYEKLRLSTLLDCSGFFQLYASVLDRASSANRLKPEVGTTLRGLVGPTVGRFEEEAELEIGTGT